MPRWPKKTTDDKTLVALGKASQILDDAPVPTDNRIALDETGERILPFALKRELEEITKNSGRVFDLSLSIDELEAICNDANRPSDAWRYRWRG